MSFWKDIKDYRVGLDIGTHYTRIWKSEAGVVLRCPTAAAVDTRNQRLVALGGEACRMIGKTPEHIMAIRPMVDGVIGDCDTVSGMLAGLFDAKDICTLFRRPAVLLAVPYHMDTVHQMVMEGAVLNAGARCVASVPAIFAAAVGEKLAVASSRAHLILSMGGGVTDVAVISSGSVIHAESLKVAGNRLNRAIINYMKNKQGLTISESDAEMLKLELGTADPRIDRGRMVIHGRNAHTQLAESRVVTSQHICDAITPAIDAVAKLVLRVLNAAPHEMERELRRLGVMVTGGSSQLPGFERFLAQKTGLRVVMSLAPQDSVINGLGILSQKPELWHAPLEFHRK